MLAGRMKLNTFLLLAGGIGGALVVGGAWALSSMGGDEPPVHVAEMPAPKPATRITETPAPTTSTATPPTSTATPPAATTSTPTPTAEPASVVGTAAKAPSGAREADAVVLSYVGKDLGSDKRKDVTKGKPYKVNVYQDAGKPTANRAKLDLDRDDKWDEKFTFEDGNVTREVAPNDDEAYSLKYRWDGNAWVAG